MHINTTVNFTDGTTFFVGKMPHARPSASNIAGYRGIIPLPGEFEGAAPPQDFDFQEKSAALPPRARASAL
jgi:hypothetical protein